MLPNFIIIGAARCATSYLSKNIMQHPDVFLHPKKELHFFDRHYHKGINYYEDFFKNVQKIAIGEATPAYLYFSHIPPLIRKHIPNVKLIASLRNPTDRAYSHYWNIVARKRMHNEYFNYTFENQIHSYDRLIKEGFYYDMLYRYFDIFPKENIMILFYEELIKESQKHYKRIFKFLGVDYNFVPSNSIYRINASSTKNAQSKILYILYLFFTKKIKSYKFANVIQNFNKSTIPEMNQNTRERLNIIFSDQIEKLEKFLDKDLSFWRR
ncbi:putative sulfotransferase domain protein [Desulfosarcina variabilis str. Montpellier]|uniref:sulfotransferase family protein n=1 Tax=Desulfosarcina variabilis TaxID=2300 RepID=UPI003AFA656B